MRRVYRKWPRQETDTEYPGVFKYCIQGCQGRCCVESKGKESAQKMEGYLGDSREGGSSGETKSSFDARFVTLSLSISMKRKVIACSGGCEALVDTRTSLTLAQEDCSITYRSSTLWGSKVKKGHAPGSLPVSTHKKDLQGQPLSISLSNSTTFHVLPSIPCPLLSSPSTASTTQCQLEPTSTR